MSSLWSFVIMHMTVISTIAITLIGRDTLSFILSKVGILQKSAFGCSIHLLLIISGIALLIPTLLLFFFWHTLVVESRHEDSVKKMGELLETFSKGWSKEVASE